MSVSKIFNVQAADNTSQSVFTEVRAIYAILYITIKHYCLAIFQMLSTVVLMVMHYKTPIEAIHLAQQSQQCIPTLVLPLSILSRLKKTLDDLAFEGGMFEEKQQELCSPEKVYEATQVR